MKKGIYQQIRELGETNIELPTKTEFAKMCDKISENSIKARAKKLQLLDGNMKHLNKRSKELGKEIPMELLSVIIGAPNGIPYVGNQFIEKYREWIN